MAGEGTGGQLQGVGADRIVVERDPSYHAMRVLLPAVAAFASWVVGAWLGGSRLNLGPFGIVPTISLLWFIVDAVASFADGADRRVIEVGQDGVWLPETGYRPWTDFADVAVERAAPTTTIATLTQPRIPLPRRLGFTPRDLGITIIEPAAPRVARSIRRLRDRFVAVGLRWNDPGAPLGIDEREIGRREFERVMAAIANEIPLGGLEDPRLTHPATVALADAARKGGGPQPAWRRNPWVAISIAIAVGVLALNIAGQLANMVTVEEFTYPPDEPFTFEPEEPAPPTVEVVTAAPVTDAPVTDAPPSGEAASGDASPIPPTMPPGPDVPPPSGALQQISLGGQVPDGAVSARLALRVNDTATDAVCCGPANLTIYWLEYAEGNPAVEIARWDDPFLSEGAWETAGTGGSLIATNSDDGDGMMLRAIVEDESAMGFDGPYVDVVAGEAFTAKASVRVSPSTIDGVAQLQAVFLDVDGVEIARIGVPLIPAGE